MMFPGIFVVLLLLGFASATVHHLFVGTFSTYAIYALEFDDESYSLTLAANITTPSEHPWINLSHDRKSLYAASGTEYGYFNVVNSTSITYNASVPLDSNCSSTRAIYITSSKVEPYTVYGVPFGDCGTVIPADFSSITQNYTFTLGSSGVHGLALLPNSTYLYAADDSDNKIWTFGVDVATGELTDVATLAAPSEGNNPRHLTVHPNGEYLYVILEEANEVAQYSIDWQTHQPVYSNVSYSLLPPGSNVSTHWADEVQVSANETYLWATTRSRETNDTGYLSVFSLNENGTISEQLFITPTTTSGGSANAISPATFADEFAAITDTSVGFVEIWQLLDDASNATVVAHIDLIDGGCCANAVWYD
ncbi:Lactonase, 7-bladed beta-propeller-domain-containing protein [Desarmillaria tabescens]|uniref:Lactonase, 7-bladed beta-propeller-domain-containing protein n=1 Tax=Armillaria tabescens TaxID=1929756 RepID=A0AA39KC96_ARMTA|nr:Lactonase, 7-bladed beta-propeller-domain-containing protein [Desarmillaria tabescens]KAK0457320.1 Lactonase, 7-bladed beta-propeller-domain-containing protein [Desarmillaria tabescens]